MSTKLIHYRDIIIPENRQRRHHDINAHQELVESIMQNGLLNAINLREAVSLVAGERRVRAISDIYDLNGTVRYCNENLPTGFIPFTDLGELPYFQARLIELEENTRRLDLTWQEKAAATAELVSLRQQQAGEKCEPVPTISELATEIHPDWHPGAAHESVREEVLVARHLDNPLVKSAKTRKEAIKLLKKEEKERKHAELADRIGSDFKSNNFNIYLADCLQWMDAQPKGQFDVIVTDPPYGMGADEFGFSQHQYKDDEEVLIQIMKTLPAKLYRIAKEQAHLYLFCDPDWFIYIRDQFEFADWKVFRTPLIWHKPNGFRAPWPEHGPRRNYEFILYARKGDKKVQKLASDVLVYDTDSNLGHHAQKPVGLYTDLLRRSVTPGERVFDPFCGTGTVFEAAQRVLCSATGVEMSDVFYGISAERITKLGEKK